MHSQRDIHIKIITLRMQWKELEELLKYNRIQFLSLIFFEKNTYLLHELIMYNLLFISVHLRKIYPLCAWHSIITHLFCVAHTDSSSDEKCSDWFGFGLCVWKPDKLNIIWMDFVNNETTLSFSTPVALYALSPCQLQVLSMINILMLSAIL